MDTDPFKYIHIYINNMLSIMGERERTQDQEYGNEIHCYVTNFKKTQPHLVIRTI